MVHDHVPIYLAATVLTSFRGTMSFMCLPLFYGGCIAGEYAAINSAIDELIPARRRGHTDLAIMEAGGSGRRPARAARRFCSNMVHYS